MLTDLMSNAPGLEMLLRVVLLPIEIIHDVTWAALNFLTFDVLQLGPFLPIQLG